MICASDFTSRDHDAREVLSLNIDGYSKKVGLRFTFVYPDEWYGFGS